MEDAVNKANGNRNLPAKGWLPDHSCPPDSHVDRAHNTNNDAEENDPDEVGSLAD